MIPLSFSTTLTKADLIRLQLRVYFQPADLLRVLGFWTLVVVGVLIFLHGPKKAFSNLPLLFFSGFGGAIGSCVVVLLAELARIWIAGGKTPGLLGVHHFELREDGLLEKTEVGESLTLWRSIADVRSGKDWINVEVQPGLFHYIPSSTFPESGQFQALADELRRRVSVAKAA